MKVYNAFSEALDESWIVFAEDVQDATRMLLTSLGGYLQKMQLVDGDIDVDLKVIELKNKVTNTRDIM